MDDVLHAARIDRRTRRQATYFKRAAELPDGVFVRSADGRPSLVWSGALHPYLGEGYGPPERLPLRTDHGNDPLRGSDSDTVDYSDAVTGTAIFPLRVSLDDVANDGPTNDVDNVNVFAKLMKKAEEAAQSAL